MRTNVDLVKQQLIDGDLAKALKSLDSTLQNTEYGDGLVLLQGRYNRLLKNKVLGVVDDNDFDAESNKITLSVLNLLKTVKSDFFSKEMKIEPNLYFFESPYEQMTPKEERIYANQFENSKTRSIGWELRGNFPALQFPISLGIKWRGLNPENVYSADYFADFTLLEGWGVCWLHRLWGYKDYGKWKTGKYQIDVFIDDNQIGKGNFTII